MKKSILEREQVERLADFILQSNTSGAVNDSLTIRFKSLGVNYTVWYKKDIEGYWKFWNYDFKI